MDTDQVTMKSRQLNVTNESDTVSQFNDVNSLADFNSSISHIKLS